MAVRHELVLLLLLALCAGCSGQPRVSNDPSTSQTVESPSGTKSPVPPQSVGSPPSSEVNSNTVKLAPLPTKYGLKYSLEVPEGWTVQPTVLGDSVQINKGPIHIIVQVERLGDLDPPRSVTEWQTLVEKGASDVVVHQVEFPGTQLAFEVARTYKVANQVMRELDLYLYGSTHIMTVITEAPLALFPTWEPVFRQILSSVKPGNLDVESLGERP